MMTLKVLSDIEGLLLSERVTYRGNEIPLLNATLTAINNEKSLLVAAQRVKPAETAPPEA